MSMDVVAGQNGKRTKEEEEETEREENVSRKMPKLETEEKENASGGKQGNVCQVCNEKESKYTCPRTKCRIRFCSIACCKSHKEKLSCSGKDEVTEFVSLSSFNDNQLHRDFKFLEDVGRAVGSSSRKVPQKQRLHPSLGELRKQLKKRNVTISFLPEGMSRRSNNLTKYDSSKDQIIWYLELSFPSDAQVFTTTISEKETVASMIQRYTKVQSGNSALRAVLPTYSEPQTNISSLHVLTKLTGKPANEPEYVELEKEMSLEQVFSGLSFVEYPVLQVVLSTELENYPRAAES